MTIRKTIENDLDAIMDIFAGARTFMRENGNFEQWKNAYPPRELIESDLNAGNSYVCIENNRIAATFYFSTVPDPTYEKINGQWLNQRPYGVVHRIAVNHIVKGAGVFCLNWCYEQCRNLKIDTHQDNLPMRKLLGKLDFTYCGIIWLLNGDERIAFQKSSDGLS